MGIETCKKAYFLAASKKLLLKKTKNMELMPILLLDDLTPSVRGEAAQDLPLPCPLPLLLFDTSPAGYVVSHFTAFAAFKFN